MKKVFLLCIIALTIIAGCSQQDLYVHDSSTPPALTYTIGSDDWSVLTKLQASDNVIEAYQFALDHPEVLDYMPCYCGCYEEDGHIGNTDCFVESVEGNVATLDNMGLG